jgi:hypothetical protein
MADILQGFSASDLMNVWERGSSLDNVGRAVLMLAQGSSISRDDASHVDLARRDQQLLALRSATFGPRLDIFLACEACKEPLELSLDAREFSIPRPDMRGENVTMQVDGLSMRLPDSTDLAAVGRCRSVGEARHTLYIRCVTQAAEADTTSSTPEHMMELFSKWLAEAAPEMDIVLAVDCPACAAHRDVSFDIGSFFWREIESACGNLVREVDALARTYGWSETHILSMSAARRRLYLEAVTS